MEGELVELAERCERADGPDMELDALIEVYLQRPLFPDAAVVKLGKNPAAAAFKGKGRGWRRWGMFFQTHRYTASIDAAMTLADGLGGQLTFFKDGTAKAFLWQPYPLAIETKVTTPALALCAAALRARAPNAR